MKSGRGHIQKIRRVVSGLLEGAVRQIRLHPELEMTTIATMTIRVPDKEEMHVYVGASEMTDRIVEKAVRAILDESTVTIQGVEVWMGKSPVIVDRRLEGSQVYDWDKSGDRIKCEFTLYTRDEAQRKTTGLPSQMLLGYRYISWEAAWV